jgi:hypothetical protein
MSTTHAEIKNDKLATNGQAKEPEAKTRAPKRPAIILIKEQIDKLSNGELKEIAGYCDEVKKARKAKADAESAELS